MPASAAQSGLASRLESPCRMSHMQKRKSNLIEPSTAHITQAGTRWAGSVILCYVRMA